MNIQKSEFRSQNPGARIQNGSGIRLQLFIEKNNYVPFVTQLKFHRNYA